MTRKGWWRITKQPIGSCANSSKTSTTKSIKILAAKINRIGLKKLPAVDKNIEKSQDIKMLQLEVDNQRKRLEQLQHDNENLKVRITVDHMTLAKELEDKLALKSTPLPT